MYSAQTDQVVYNKHSEIEIYIVNSVPVQECGTNTFRKKRYISAYNVLCLYVLVWGEAEVLQDLHPL
jgi:hypothetical protein